MKYFTPELYIRGNSSDPAKARGVEQAWEDASRAYARRWRKVQKELPENVRRFADKRVCLHDARVLHLAQEGNRFVAVLRLAPPANHLVILHCELSAAPIIVTDALPPGIRTQSPSWLYEEFDLDRDGNPSLEVMLSNGWIVELKFHDFHYWLMESLFPSRKRGARKVAG